MNLILQPGNVRCPASLASLIETRLVALAARQRIEEALVRLSAEREANPRFQAAISIRVPGPDIHAAACDHTPRVAVQKALAAVEAQIEARHVRRRQRARGLRQLTSAVRTGRSL
ncbi:HPF/RaiA family ribosome-associated protein [Horticoccus sp. 23ND18S-11]|uniref:HPF/RaiA family ribosome-associated protein n=1 Tax=Horticoccus sp. 23ND18S-11 TaxID=3391832 RepID=UPI0039C9DE9B